MQRAAQASAGRVLRGGTCGCHRRRCAQPCVRALNASGDSGPVTCRVPWRPGRACRAPGGGAEPGVPAPRTRCPAAGPLQGPPRFRWASGPPPRRPGPRGGPRRCREPRPAPPSGQPACAPAPDRGPWSPGARVTVASVASVAGGPVLPGEGAFRRRRLTSLLVARGSLCSQPLRALGRVFVDVA